VPCAKGDKGTPPVFGLCRELWTGRRSAKSRQRNGTQACHMHHGYQRDGSNGQNLGWKLCVKDKWVKLDSRTLDPEWRDSAGRAKKGNNGSRRPYIKPQGAGSESSVDHEESKTERSRGAHYEHAETQERSSSQRGASAASRTRARRYRYLADEFEELKKRT